MATLKRVEDQDAGEEVQELFEGVKAGFGAGSVPTAYRVLANNPTALKTTLEHRSNVMNQGDIDPVLKEWLAWATVTLGNNVFGIKVHTARLKKMGISSAQIVEALTVLGYFSGINTVINGLAMDDDVEPAVLEYLEQSE